MRNAKTLRINARSLLYQILRSSLPYRKNKADNQMEWVSRVNNIEARAREIVNHELIFTA